jgi:hypothetical protein
MRPYLDRLRLWLADLLYGWACRLAGHDMITPRSPEAPGAWGMLHAQRHERIAREWHDKYVELRKKGLTAGGGRMVQF